MGRIVLKAFGLLIVVTAVAIGWLAVDYRDFLDTPVNRGEAPRLYEVAPGTSLNRIAWELHDKDMVQRPRYLVWLARWMGVSHKIQAGEYEVMPGMRPRSFLEMLVAGNVRRYSLTVVEGWTFREMMSAIAGHDAIEHTLDGLDNAEIMRRIGHDGEHPEGRFLPETYHFPRGTKDTDFLSRAYDAMQLRLAEEWARRQEDLPLETPYEALVLASIVEKETALTRERAQIAGVFVRRLQRGMRLQTDPTVIYGLGESFDGNLRRSDLRNDTPYNTYTRGGLPPTPIALPSGEAIHAVLHPAPGNSLYFVSKGDGSHHFSETLKEHNRAVVKYQLGGRSRSFSSNP